MTNNYNVGDKVRVKPYWLMILEGRTETDGLNRLVFGAGNEPFTEAMKVNLNKDVMIRETCVDRFYLIEGADLAGFQDWMVLPGHGWWSLILYIIRKIWG